MNKKIFSTTLAILMLASAPLTYNASISDYLSTLKIAEEVAPAAATDIVTFPDAEFEDALARSQGWTVGEITVGDMESLTTLDLSWSFGVTDITGIEYAVNLTSLTITVSDIRDLSPLSGLTNLTHLDISSNRIGDISPLSGLTNLTYLDISSNPIGDMSPLSGLTNLTYLDLHGNQISDLSPLSGLTNLTYLDLNGTKISDLSPLSEMVNLTYLDLGNNQISDISPLSEMVNLTYLDLYFNEISDVSPLSGLTNLTYLALNDNQISDISALSEMVNLTYLDLGNNQISDISALSEMVNLTTLYLTNNQITDISPLSKMVNLTDLESANNQISDVSPLSEMVNLTTLYLSSNQITDLSGLSNLIKLDYLYADDNQITDISALAEIDPTIIYLSHNQITDISALEGKTPLYLRLDNNGISDLSPLAAMSNAEDTLELSVYSQAIQPADLKVTDNNEIFYNLTNITGEVVPVSLGVPTPGYSTLTAEFQMDVPVENGFIDMAEGDGFSGTITQNVSFTTLTGVDNTTTTEETSLTDSELIEMFEVTSNIDSVISVDQSAVDYTTPGEYQVVFTDTDSNEFIGTLTVTDILPVLTTTENTTTVEIGSSAIDYLTVFGPVATEITDGDLTSSISVDDSAVNLNVTGSYDLVFAVSDAEGNEVTTTVTVIVERDVTPEVDPITPEVEVVSNLTGTSSATTTEETSLTDAELISLFAVTNDQDREISVDQSAVDYTTPGEYQVVFTDTDSNEFIGTLTVTDVLPVLTTTENTTTVEIGSSAIDYLTVFGPVATEITDGDLTSSISVDDSDVNLNVSGSYDLVFAVSDAEGNEVTTTVTVIVERDVTTEVDPITPEVDVVSNLTGTSSATTTEETSLTDAELISLFAVSNDQDREISVDQSAVDYTTPGEYQVVFTDTDNNQFIGTLTVTDVIPTLMINNTEITLTSGSNSNDLIAALDMSATEITDGDLTASIVVDDSNVNYDVVGTYEVYVSVVDQEGNIVSQTITVVIESDDTSGETGSEIESETGSEVTTDETDSEVTTDDNDDYKQLSLANTGSELILTIIGLVIFVLVIVGIKKVVVKK